MYSRLKIAAAILAVTVLASTAVWLELAPDAPDILVNDQWTFLYPVLHEKSLWEQFNQQAGMPRQGIGNFLYTWPALTMGWSGHGQLAWMIGFYCIASWLAIYWKSKIAGLQFHDVLLPFIFIKPSMQDTLVYTPNPAYSAIPLVLLFGLLNLLECRLPKPLKLPLIAILTWVATCTHFGFFTPFALIAWTLLNHRLSTSEKIELYAIALVSLLAYLDYAEIMVVRGAGLPTPPGKPWIALSIVSVLAAAIIIHLRTVQQKEGNGSLVRGAGWLVAFSGGFAFFAAVGRS